jgi:DNA (cytosine-5)-methyltransferase 1
MLAIINAKQPNILLLENVKNITVIENGTVLQKILRDLDDANYNVSYCVLNTSKFGLAQNRSRVFFVGINRRYFDTFFDFEGLHNTFERKKIRDFPTDLPNNYIPRDSYVLLEETKWKAQISGLIFCGYIKGNIRKKGAKPNTNHLSRVHKQPNRIYHINGVHPTLSSSETSGRYYIYDGVGVRKLNIKECYAITGYPNDFKMHGKTSVCYRHIGNTVSPVIIKKIKSELISQKII